MLVRRGCFFDVGWSDYRFPWGFDLSRGGTLAQSLSTSIAKANQRKIAAFFTVTGTGAVKSMFLARPDLERLISRGTDEGSSIRTEREPIHVAHVVVIEQLGCG